jgi:hypothetical protein
MQYNFFRLISGVLVLGEFQLLHGAYFIIMWTIYNIELI